MKIEVSADGTLGWCDRRHRCALGRGGVCADKREGDGATPSGCFLLRRVLYRLHAMIKVHLAEDEEYQRLLERTLSEEEQAQLVRGLEHTVTDPLSLAPDHGAG